MTLMMSVSGVRGIIGQTMTPVLAAELGATFGTHLGTGSVVIGRDSRPSGDMVRSALVSGLLASGRDVIDLGVVTTPSVAIMVRELGAAGGVVLTASHNPIVWNGVKFLTGDGYAPPPETAAAILDRYKAKQLKYVDIQHIGRLKSDDRTNEIHVSKVLAIVDAPRIRERKFKVVLDSVNGAGGAGGRMLLERLGCQVVHMNAEPTGIFAHTPEPTRENLTTLCDAVRANHADLGFAQDPDADRLAIVDNHGEYIGEEYTLALAARNAFRRERGAAAANLSTSRMVDDIAQAAGAGPVHRTPVGEAHVARAVREKRCVLGGEGNGGVIDPRIVLVRDSFTAMAVTLDLLAAEERSLDGVVRQLPHYVMVKQKFDLTRAQIDNWMLRVPTVAAGGRVDSADGVRIDWPEGWVHVRPSNTEPIARVIAEAADEATAAELAQRVTDLL